MSFVGLLLVILSFAVLNNEDRYEFRLKFDHDAKAIEESIMLQDPASSWADAFSPDNLLMVDNDPVDLVAITSCTGQTEDEIVMGVQHKELPVYGVQYHPESILTQYGHELLDNFLKISGLKK